MADVTDLYYNSAAPIGYGSQLLVGQDDGSPETFTAVPEVKSIGGGKFSSNIVDRTHLRSPGRHKEKTGGMRDSDPIQVVANYLPTHGAHKNAGGDGFLPGRSLLSLHRNQTEANFHIYKPDTPEPDTPGSETGTTQLVRGVITQYQIGDITTEGLQEVTIQITPIADYSGSWA